MCVVKHKEAARIKTANYFSTRLFDGTSKFVKAAIKQ